MIDLKKLIKAASFPDDLKQQLLVAVDGFSDNKKFELQNICWDSISAKFHSKLDYELQRRTLEAVTKNQPFSREDARKLEEDAYSNLLRELESVDDREKMDEVREKLQQQTPTPPKAS